MLLELECAVESPGDLGGARERAPPTGSKVLLRPLVLRRHFEWQGTWRSVHEGSEHPLAGEHLSLGLCWLSWTPCHWAALGRKQSHGLPRHSTKPLGSPE